MITPSPPSYAFLQVERKAQGAQRLLTQAQEVGRQVLGVDIDRSTSLTRYGMGVSEEIKYDEPEEPYYSTTPLANPMLEVCAPNDLAMIINHYGVRGDLASRHNIAPAMSKLSAIKSFRYETVYDDSGARHRAKIREKSLTHELADISIAHGLDPNNTPVSCSSIGIIDEPGGDFVLGLFPDPTTEAYTVLQEQSQAVQSRLERIGARIASSNVMDQIAAPFGRFPGKTSQIELDRLMEGLNDLTPIRMTLGAPEVHGRARP